MPRPRDRAVCQPGTGRYTLTRTFRATDACGNSTTVSQVITVVDVTPPQFTNDPIDVISEVTWR